MRYVTSSVKKIYSRFSLIMLSVSIFVLLALLDFFLLTRTTSWDQFINANNPLYVFLAINLSWINNLFISFAITMLVYIVDEKKKHYAAAAPNSFIGIFLSLVSVGCAVCGGFLLPIVGIAASLTAFPFQGLEIKAISIALLLYAINSLSLQISMPGVFKSAKKQRHYLFPYIIGVGAVVLVYLIPRLTPGTKNYFGALTKEPARGVQQNTAVSDNLFNEINPENGVEINASYGDLGPKMIQSGVIDLEKVKSLYGKSEQPLSKEQLEILTKGSDKKVKIDRENSYFLLNFFWAAGLANKSKILTEGDIAKYGKGEVGNFASTGGWSLAKGDLMSYYAKTELIPLTTEQERRVESVSSNIYRPCCNNSTAFPDCNHGMALLAVLQLMASNGATENQMYEAAKYFNAYWFPGNYYDLALYFKNKSGKDFKSISGREILAKEFSSASGWQNAKQWLSDKGIIKQPPKQGGGCGV